MAAETPVLRQITTFTIGGTDRRAYLAAGSVKKEEYVNGRKVLTFDILDPRNVLNLLTLERVIYAVDSVIEFNGVIFDYEATQMPEQPNTIQYKITCVDMSYGLDEAMINGIYGPGTLSSLLTTVMANATPFGLALDPGQSGYGTDPSMEVQTWEFLTLRQALDRLGMQAGRLWVVDQTTLYLSMREPFTIAAPRSFDETNTTIGSGILAGSIKVNKSRDKYANSVWLKYGPSGPALVTEQFLGTGALATFDLGYTFIQPNIYATLTYFDGVSTGTQTVGVDGNGGLWNVDTATNTLTRLAGAIPVGGYVQFQYFANFPVYVNYYDPVDYALYGPHTIVIEDPGLLQPAEADAMGLALLARNQTQHRTIRFLTQFGLGFNVLQAVTLNLPSFNASTSDWLITEVQVRQIAQRDYHGTGVTGIYYEWEILATEDLTIYDWLDDIRDEPLQRGGSLAPTPPPPIPAVECVSSGLTCYPIGARGVALTTVAGAAWTNSAYVEIISAANAPAVSWSIEGIHVDGMPDLEETEFDIALGASGSEVVFATLRVGGNTHYVTGLMFFPILYGPVTANTRVAIRARNRGEVNGGVSKVDNMFVKLCYYAMVPGGVTTTTAIMKAAPPAALMTVTASATAWANGAWAQVTAATTEAWQLVSVNTTEAGLTFNAAGDDIEIDVGVGASGSEVVITTVRIETRESNSASLGVVFDPVLINQIPSGSRVALRARHRRAAAMTFNVALMYYGGSL